MARQGGAAPRNAPSTGPESSARISERRPEFNGGGRDRSDRISGPNRLASAGTLEKAGTLETDETLEMRRGNARAIAPPHQHAILGLAQIRDAHGKPNSNRGQRHGKGEGREVRQHAMAKIVRFFAGEFIARQIVRLAARVLLPNRVAEGPPARGLRQGARPELEHAVLFFRCNGPLGFHCWQFREILTLFSMAHARLAENVDMGRMRYTYPSKVSWNLP